MTPEDIAKLITEDPDTPADAWRRPHRWDRVKEMEIEEFEDKKIFGDQMFNVSFVVGADFQPGEPMVRYYPDGSGYPGSPPHVEWDVLDVTGVVGEHGDIELTPELKERLMDSIRGQLDDEKVMEYMFPDDRWEPDEPDDYPYD